jgi:hypothetical protein
MRRLVLAGVVLVALAVGFNFAISATQAQTEGTITITVDSGGKVSVKGNGKYLASQAAPSSVSTASKTRPVSLIVFFNNPPGCVFVPNTGDWYCP